MAEIKFHYLNALPQNPNSKELYFIKDTSNDKGKLYRGSQLIAETSAAEIKSLANNVATALEAIQQGYETKTDATSKLTEAKSYADTAAAMVKNDLLNGAGAAYDTLKELGDLIDENVDAIEALETVAANKSQVQIITWEADD